LNNGGDREPRRPVMAFGVKLTLVERRRRFNFNDTYSTFFEPLLRFMMLNCVWGIFSSD
jgi:hypothetical protein